ncbi:MAG: hypothetical protein ACI81L_003253 [Verrucomicrobiales bacterium]|jgi:hypothetical protein
MIAVGDRMPIFLRTAGGDPWKPTWLLRELRSQQERS